MTKDDDVQYVKSRRTTEKFHKNVVRFNFNLETRG